jgi:hypothetical protein
MPPPVAYCRPSARPSALIGDRGIVLARERDNTRPATLSKLVRCVQRRDPAAVNLPADLSASSNHWRQENAQTIGQAQAVAGVFRVL